MSSEITCNACLISVDGTAYRTSCRHLFCLQCATDAFTSGISCPLCSNILSRSEVHSVSIGNSKGIDISNILFEFVLNSKEWKVVVDNISSTFDGIKEISTFFSHQLYLECERSQINATGLFDELKSFKDEMMKVNEEHVRYSNNVERKMSEYESSLAAKEKELNEFKAAYKEKLRKCQAWEKAYNSLRDQLSDPKQSELSIQQTRIPSIPSIQETESSSHARGLTKPHLSSIQNQSHYYSPSYPTHHSIAQMMRREVNTIRHGYHNQSQSQGQGQDQSQGQDSEKLFHPIQQNYSQTSTTSRTLLHQNPVNRVPYSNRVENTILPSKRNTPNFFDSA